MCCVVYVVVMVCVNVCVWCVDDDDDKYVKVLFVCGVVVVLMCVFVFVSLLMY